MEVTPEQLNDLFCKEIGIKKACCYLLNKDTKEIRFYSSPSGLYKKPVGWKNCVAKKFDKPRYPDFINNPANFSTLINVQWYLFGSLLGETYTKETQESFECNYVKKKLEAIRACESFGGGEMLQEYKKQLRDLSYDYLTYEDEEEE